MSYNIDTFIIKEIEGLQIPLQDLYHPKSKFPAKNRRASNGGVDIGWNDTLYVRGEIVGTMLECSDIKCHGYASGDFMHHVLEPAFEHSHGVFIASCIWEGGDSVDRITVRDGDIDWTDIRIERGNA